MASGPITSWQIDGETVKTVSDFIFFSAPKSLQMVTAAMILKDDPEIPLLGIHTKETRMERDMCTPMFITALFYNSQDMEAT